MATATTTTTTAVPPGTTTTVPGGAPVITNWGAGQADAVGLGALDPGIFYRYSSMVYPAPPSGWTPEIGTPIEENFTWQQYEYAVFMANALADTIMDRAGGPAGRYPSWFTMAGTGPGYDVFGNIVGPQTDWTDAAKDWGTLPEFIAWWNGVKDNENWLPTLASAAYRMASETDTALNFIEVGAPGMRDHRIFDYDNVVRLITKYGIDFLDLSGPHGYGLLETAAVHDLQLDPLFDIATTALERHRSTRTVSSDQRVNIQGERAAMSRAVLLYNNSIRAGRNHVQAKIYTFGGMMLGMRVMGIGDGTAESDLTGEELGTIMGILGPNWQQELAEMDAFDNQDPVGSYRFAGYMDNLVSREPVEIQGDAMREAARVLARGWRMQPLSDNELDEMVLSFGAKVRESKMMPPVWDNAPTQATAWWDNAPTQATGQFGTASTAGGGGMTETPSMATSMAATVRGTPDYERLYGNMPSGMQEEGWISKFAGASQSLTGIESRMGTEAGMQSGSLTRARQVGLTDPSSRGGAWYRRMAAWRKAFQ